MALSHLIIGAGNMGGALLSGWLKAKLITPRNLAILDPTPGTEAVFAIERGARHLTSPEDIPKSVDIVLLAVKPQSLSSTARDVSANLPPGTLLISIIAGVSLARLQALFPSARIIRAMPNTPASIGRGVSAYVASTDLDEDMIERAEALLKVCGTVVRVDSDEKINAVTAISGSGPAYLFYLAETLEAAGRSLGLDADTSAILAQETIIGASALMDASERSPSELRTAVTSPGGTTQAALDVLMSENGLGPLMRQTTRAAMDRSRDLSG
ncbi:MAG: pyrroline-5-carboxylate reductase [Pseudomonadota bacterium]